MKAGRLLLEGRLIFQSIGYHQFALLVMAFLPDGDGDHCLVSCDQVFLPELREAALLGLARARRDLGTQGTAVIGQVWAHEVDSHERDFERCAYETVARHHREPALRPPPRVDGPEALWAFWVEEAARMESQLRRALDSALHGRCFATDDPSQWHRSQEDFEETVRLVPARWLSNAPEVLYTRRVFGKEVVSSSLHRLTERPGHWPLESATCSSEMVTALLPLLLP